jgi:hypothetical protein
MFVRFLPILAAASGLGASVEAGLPYDATNPSTLDALGRWPLTVILGAVCVTCVYFMYRQSRDNSNRSAQAAQENGRIILAMVEGERAATEQRMIRNATVTHELAENNAKVVKEVAENNAKVMKDFAEEHSRSIRTLLDELAKPRIKCQ